MNEKVEQFLQSKKLIEKKKISDYLTRNGIYNTIYAPFEIVCHGHTGNKTLNFTVKSSTNVKVGDEIWITDNNEKVKVTIDKLDIIQKDEYSEYPFTEYDSTLKCLRKYKKEPISLTDEELESIKEAINPNEFKVISNNNIIANILTVIACIIFILGFILGIYMGVENADRYSDFSFFTALIYWGITLTSGITCLGFAEIIKLLEAIKNK